MIEYQRYYENQNAPCFDCFRRSAYSGLLKVFARIRHDVSRIAQPNVLQVGILQPIYMSFSLYIQCTIYKHKSRLYIVDYPVSFKFPTQTSQDGSTYSSDTSSPSQHAFHTHLHHQSPNPAHQPRSPPCPTTVSIARQQNSHYCTSYSL